MIFETLKISPRTYRTKNGILERENKRKLSTDLGKKSTYDRMEISKQQNKRTERISKEVKEEIVPN